jgi:hypothetical protein
VQLDRTGRAVVGHWQHIGVQVHVFRVGLVADPAQRLDTGRYRVGRDGQVEAGHTAVAQAYRRAVHQLESTLEEQRDDPGRIERLHCLGQLVAKAEVTDSIHPVVLARQFGRVRGKCALDASHCAPQRRHDPQLEGHGEHVVPVDRSRRAGRAPLARRHILSLQCSAEE